MASLGISGISKSSMSAKRRCIAVAKPGGESMIQSTTQLRLTAKTGVGVGYLPSPPINPDEV